MEKKTKTLKEVAALVAKESKRPSTDAVIKITTALLNEKDYVTKSVKMIKGEKKVTEMKPVEDFRGMMVGVITKAGVEEADAQKFMKDYTFKSKEGAVLAELSKSIINENLNTGKIFNLENSETCTVSLRKKHMEEAVNTYRNPKTGDEIKIKSKAHDRVVVKSSTPKFLKSKI